MSPATYSLSQLTTLRDTYSRRLQDLTNYDSEDELRQDTGVEWDTVYRWMGLVNVLTEEEQRLRHSNQDTTTNETILALLSE